MKDCTFFAKNLPRLSRAERRRVEQLLARFPLHDQGTCAECGAENSKLLHCKGCHQNYCNACAAKFFEAFLIRVNPSRRMQILVSWRPGTDLIPGVFLPTGAQGKEG